MVLRPVAAQIAPDWLQNKAKGRSFLMEMSTFNAVLESSRGELSRYEFDFPVKTKRKQARCVRGISVP